MNKWKCKVVVVLITILLIVLAADVVAVIPNALPWILGVFAVPGIVMFSKLLYRWMTDDEPVVIHYPKWDKKKKKFVEGKDGSN